jgi:hypothetical protein
MRLTQITLFFLICSVAGCTTYRPVDRLNGIASISRSADGVRVEPNPMLMLRIGKPVQSTSRPTSVVMKLGDHISMGDGRHVTINLRFVGLQDDRYRFVVETIHRPPMGNFERKVTNVAVPAYGQ